MNFVLLPPCTEVHTHSPPVASLTAASPLLSGPRMLGKLYKKEKTGPQLLTQELEEARGGGGGGGGDSSPSMSAKLLAIEKDKKVVEEELDAALAARKTDAEEILRLREQVIALGQTGSAGMGV